MNYLDKVEEFHKTFKAPVLENPQLIDKERAALRIRLIQEELDELKESVENNDLVEVADALADLQYVLSGAILEFGMKDIFNQMFAEVHRSNMSKTCQTEEEAFATVKYYQEQRDTPCHWVQDGEKYLVLRNSDLKVLKSINYSPADLAQFVKPRCPECLQSTDQGELIAFGGLCENCNDDYEINLAAKNGDL